jgi:predicted lipid-binding transport protein (Tim44 family)
VATNAQTSVAGPTTPVAAAPPSRARFARAGTFSGLLGALCCIGNAVAVASGLGALAFFGGWMDRYQIYFVLGSIAVMGLAITWMIRRSGLRHAKKMLLRHAAVMLVAYVVTFGFASMVSGLIAA